jgi:hypothetical protein
MIARRRNSPQAPTRPLYIRLLIRLGRLVALFCLIVGLGFGVFWWLGLRMPGRSFDGPMPDLNDAQRQLAAQMRADVTHLAATIGPRNVVHERALAESADWLMQRFSDIGYTAQRDAFEVHRVTCENIIAQKRGSTRPERIIVVGAHYDSCFDAPGANDNASGVAAVLALADMFRDADCPVTLRFACFVNEEPPYFQQQHMGSYVYAQRCRQRNDDIIAMLTPETIGCYSDAPGSQTYPLPMLNWVYPSEGTFIAFVGNMGSRDLVRRSVRAFRQNAAIPSEGAALPGWIPGVMWSDHWSFQQAGYDGVMITDTAPYRYTHYHTQDDTPDKVDYERAALVVEGIADVIRELAGVETQ